MVEGKRVCVKVVEAESAGDFERKLRDVVMNVPGVFKVVPFLVKVESQMTKNIYTNEEESVVRVKYKFMAWVYYNL